MHKLLLATLATATLLTGCAKLPAAAPLVKQPARVAAQAATPSLDGQLTVTRASAAIKDRDGMRARQEFEVTGKLDGKSFSFASSTFFPYYIPMLAGTEINNASDELKPATAAKLVKLFKAAQATDAQKQAMSMLIYGLEFRAHHEKP